MKLSIKRVALLLVCFLFIITSISYASVIKISKINDLYVTLNHNVKYTLPKTVTAIMTNGSKKIVPIYWKTTKVNYGHIGTYTYYGSVKDYNKPVKLILKVVPVITSIQDIDIHINTYENLNFPDSIDAKFSDNAFKKVPITWNSEMIDTSKAGKYVFEGIVSGYSNKVKMNVDISTLISSVDDINVTINAKEKYALPEVLKAVTNEGVEKECPVKWDTASIDTYKSGNYVYEGTIIGYSKKVKLNITINPVIESIDDLNLTLYTGDKYSIPNTIIAKMSDNTEKSVPVTWTPPTVDFNKVGQVTLIGKVEGYNHDIKYNFTIKSDIQIRGTDSKLSLLSFIPIDFTKDVIPCKRTDKIILQGEDGVIIPIISSQNAINYKFRLVLFPSHNLQKGFKYKLTIPKETIETTQGRLNEEDIIFEFVCN